MTNNRKDPDVAAAHAHTAQAGSGTASGRKDSDRSLTSDVVDTDIGGAEGQKRSVVAEGHRSLDQQDLMRNYNNQEIQDSINFKASLRAQILRSQELAIDRMWNVNITDAVEAALAGRIAELLKDK